MKMYDSVEELADAAKAALKQYQDLIGGGSAILLCCVAEQNKTEKQQEIMKHMAEDIGVEPVEQDTAPTQLKQTALSLHKKIQLYRADSPEFVVEMFEEGLSFLETLCEKYM